MITRRKFLKFLALGTATVLIPAIPTFEKPVVVHLMDIYNGMYIPWQEYDEVLCKLYLPAIKEQFSQESLMLKLFNKCETKGKNAVVEIHYGRRSKNGRAKRDS